MNNNLKIQVDEINSAVVNLWICNKIFQQGIDTWLIHPFNCNADIDALQ